MSGDRFCEGCGADLRVRRAGSVAVEKPPRCRGCGRSAEQDADGDEFCPQCGLRYRGGSDRVEVDLGALAGVSDRGLVHAHNEDAMALGRYADASQDGRVAAVVCDGVSSSRAPERAAQAAAEAALDVLLDSATAESCERRVRDAVASAARAVAARSTGDGHDDPSCTIVAAVVDATDAARPRITVGWIGDSRAYWLAAPGAAEPSRRLTVDDSWATEMREPEDIDDAATLNDPHAHVLTRWLGPGGASEPGVALFTPDGPGMVLLCTDGLWNYLPVAADLAKTALAVTDADGDDDGLALRRAAALTTVALEAGGRDNITVAVIPITPRRPT
jgi:serine/threonine protein phosphatase PrpC